MKDYGRSWCPECQRWVPADSMNILQDDNRVLRVCTWCLEQNPFNTSEEFVLDEHHEDTQCIYCGSWDTTEQAPKWLQYQCNCCGATFWRV